MRCTLVILFVTISNLALTQYLSKMDEIFVPSGHIADFEVVNREVRIYNFNRLFTAPGTAVFNDDSISLVPYFDNLEQTNAASYLFATDPNGNQYVKYPGSQFEILVTDSSYWTPFIFGLDSIITPDTSYRTIGNRVEFVMHEYDWQGSLLQSKHWSNPQPAYFEFTNFSLSGGGFLFGGFHLEFDDFIIDSVRVAGSNGDMNGFFGRIDQDLRFQWVCDYGGVGSHQLTSVASNSFGHSLFTGITSHVPFVDVCDDRIQSQVQISHPVNVFPVVYLTDQSGNKINTVTPNFDISQLGVRKIATMSDGSFILLCGFNGGYMKWQDQEFECDSSFGFQAGPFVIKLDTHLNSKSLFHAEYCPGVQEYEDIVVIEDDIIWLCGYTEEDSMQFDSYKLTKDPSSDVLPFYIKLNSELVVLDAFKSSALGRPLLISSDDDGNLYSVHRDSSGKHTSYQILDSISSVNDPANKFTEDEISIFPNPVQNGGSLYIQHQLNSDQVVCDIFIYDMLGRLHYSWNSVKLSTSVSIKDLPPGVYLIRVKFKFGSEESRLFVVDK